MKQCNYCGAAQPDQAYYCNICGNQMMGQAPMQNNNMQQPYMQQPYVQQGYNPMQNNMMGYNPYYPGEKQRPAPKSIGGRIYGIIALSVGAVGAIISALIIMYDKQPKGLRGQYYTYAAPLTVHELIMIFSVVLCVCLAISGLITLIISIVKN